MQKLLSVVSGVFGLEILEISLYYISDIPLMAFVLYLSFKGWTALHFAARNNNVEAVKLLLSNSANVNATECSVSISED